jgi:hypothetical protein
MGVFYAGAGGCNPVVESDDGAPGLRLTLNAIDLHQRLDNARDDDGFCQEPGGRDE